MKYLISRDIDARKTKVQKLMNVGCLLPYEILPTSIDAETCDNWAMELAVAHNDTVLIKLLMTYPKKKSLNNTIKLGLTNMEFNRYESKCNICKEKRKKKKEKKKSHIE